MEKEIDIEMLYKEMLEWHRMHDDDFRKDSKRGCCCSCYDDDTTNHCIERSVSMSLSPRNPHRRISISQGVLVTPEGSQKMKRAMVSPLSNRRSRSIAEKSAMFENNK